MAAKAAGAAEMASAQQSPGQSSTASTVPPHPFDKLWHVHIDGKTYGPYTGHQIRQLAEQRKILGSDLVYAEDGSVWLQISNDPILSALFKPSELARSQVASRGKPLWHRRKWVLVITVALVAVGWLVWPYYAVYDLIVAVREGDVSTLEARVAWESVRQGLRSDLNAMLLQKLGNDAKAGTNSGGALETGLAVMLGPVIVDRMVDSYVTPQAVAALNRTSKSENVSSNVTTAPRNFNETIQAAREIRWGQIKYAFFSGGPLTFRVEFLPDQDSPLQHPTEFRFQWDGNWRLTRIILPADAIDELPAAAKSQGTGGASFASKTPTPQATSKPASERSPQPLDVALVSKGFKASNPRANDYEDDITITLSIKNILDNDIRAFDGVVTFTDLLDNVILSSKIAINDPLKAGGVLNWSGVIKFNQFIDSHQRLRNERQENLKIKFATRKVLFADGSSKEY